MSSPWIKQYQPKSIKEAIGLQEQAKMLLEFCKNYKLQKEKGIILYGPSGTGKSTLAYCIAEELDFELLEVNASDTRNKKSIQETLGHAVKQQSFFSSGKIILIDEVDGVTGTYDRGGIPEIVNLINETKYPIILTCADPFSKKLKPLKKVCKLIELPHVSTTDITEILAHIAKKESIDVEKEVLQGLARKSQGDTRAAINDFQLLSAGSKRITKEDFDELTTRAKVSTIEEALTTVFKSTEAKQSINAFDEVPEDIDQRFLWLDYNLPKEYTKRVDLARAYAYLAKADIYRSRIMRRQHWRFLVYINTLQTAGITVAKDEPYKTQINYQQTTRLLKIWQVNMSQAKKKSIAQKLATHTHTSSRTITKDFGFFHNTYKKNKDYAQKINEQLDLSKEEVAWLKK